jgi:hypothetical protein
MTSTMHSRFPWRHVDQAGSGGPVATTVAARGDIHHGKRRPADIIPDIPKPKMACFLGFIAFYVVRGHGDLSVPPPINAEMRDDVRSQEDQN